MSSFSKVIQPKPASFFKTHQPLHICSFNSLDDNDLIGAGIPIPGNFETSIKCENPHHLKIGLSMYIKDLHARNAVLLKQPRYNQPPCNYNYNIANLMNLQFDARKRGDFIAVKRFQQLINLL